MCKSSRRQAMASNTRQVPDDAEPLRRDDFEKLPSSHTPTDSRMACITEQSTRRENLLTVEKNACSSSKREMAMSDVAVELRSNTVRMPPIAGQPPEVAAAITARKHKSNFSQQMLEPDFLKNNVRPDFAKVNTSVKIHSERSLYCAQCQGQQVRAPAMASCMAIDSELCIPSLEYERCIKGQSVTVDAEVKVFPPASTLANINVTSMANQNALVNSPYSTEAISSTVESVRHWSPRNHEQRDTDKQELQIAASSLELSTTQNAMNSTNDLPEASKQDPRPRRDVAVHRHMRSAYISGSDERVDLQKPVASHAFSALQAQQNLSIRAGAADTEANGALPQSSAFQPQSWLSPQMHQQESITGQRSFHSMAEMAMRPMQEIPVPYSHLNRPQRQLAYPANQHALPPAAFHSNMLSARIDNICNNAIDGNYTPGSFNNFAGEDYNRANSMNRAPSSGYTVPPPGFIHPCYSNQFYGFNTAECRITSPSRIPQSPDHGFSISSVSPSVSSDSHNNSLSPYSTPYSSRHSSPGSPYDCAQPPVHAGQYAVRAQISPSSSANNKFWSTSASARSPSSVAGSSSPDSVPSFQREGDVLIMDGVVIDSQMHANRSCSTPPNHQQRARKSIREAGSPSQEWHREGRLNPESPPFVPWGNSSSTIFLDHVRQQGDSKLLKKGHSRGHFSTDSDSSSSSELRIIEGLTRAARHDAESNTGKTAAESGPVKVSKPRSEPPEYSPEVVRELKLPANLDFLYDSTSEHVSSTAVQAQAAISNSPPYLNLHENESCTSAKITCYPSKEATSTAQSSDTPNMSVAALKSPAISPAKHSNPLLEHASEAPAHISTKGTLVETAQLTAASSPSPGKSTSSPRHMVKAAPHSPSQITQAAGSIAKESPSLPKSPSPSVETAPSLAESSSFLSHTPGKSTSSHCTGSSSSPQHMAKAALHTPSQITQAAGSPAKKSPPLPTSPSTPSKETPSPSNKMAKMASPAKRPPIYPKKAKSPISPSKYPPS